MNKVLEISNLSKKFGDNKVLKNINLDINEGEVVVIVGKSGCGKSTLLRCINLIENIDEGKIILDGEDITNKKNDIKNVRQKIGMVFQNYELFPHLNVLNNIMIAPIKVQKRNKDEVEKIAFDLLKRVGLEHKAYCMPKELSGGQKQRIAIIRALCMNPEILLFDEVTASLDPEMTREVLEVILELAKSKKTMIIVTHEMQFAKAIADRIVFISDGEIIEENTAKEFFLNPKTDEAKKFLRTLVFEI